MLITCFLGIPLQKILIISTSVTLGLLLHLGYENLMYRIKYRKVISKVKAI